MPSRTFDQRTIVPGIYEDAWQHAGDKGDAIGSNPQLKVSSETATFNAGLEGRVFNISGAITLSGNSAAAINFQTIESFVLARVSATGVAPNVEVGVYDEYATGTAGDILEPINLNLCSNEITDVFAQLYTDATPVGNLLDFGAERLSRSAIACTGKPFSIVISRRDNGVSEVIRFACAFEIFSGNNPFPDVPFIGLRAFTQLEPNTEMSTYG